MRFLKRRPRNKALFVLVLPLALQAGAAGAFETSDSDAKTIEEFRVKPEDAEAWSHYIKAEEFYFNADLPAALAEYRKAVDLNPIDFDSRYKTGLVLYEMKEHEAAIKEWKDLLNLEPGYGLAHHRLGIAYREDGKPQDAVIEFIQAFKTLREVSETRLQLGLALRETGDLDSAIEVWQKAVADQPGFAEAHYQLGLAYLEKDKRKKERALAAFEAAADADPSYAEAQDQIARIYFDSYKGRKDTAAIERWRRAIASDPGFLEARYGLGDALERMKKSSEAAAEFRDILAIDPSQAPAHMRLGYLNLAIGRSDDAIFHFEEAIALADEDAAYDVVVYTGLGKAWLAREKYQEAIDALETAVSSDPKAADAWFELGLAKRGDGDYDGALKALENYTKLAKRRSQGITEARKIMREIRKLAEEAQGEG